jgi:VanZ family protein
MHTRRAPRSPHRLRLAWTLALAYLLVIAYASLHPFAGWRMPPEELRNFLSAPWPRWITLEDVLINIAAYVPIGFLLARAMRYRLGDRVSVLAAALLGCIISTSMEAVQLFMPTRIASNVDVLTNSLGALIGALAAPLFAPTRLLGSRLARMRREWFVYKPGAEVGMVLLGLWVLTQLHPTAQLFGTGNLRNAFHLPVWVIHTPLALLTAEAAIAGFNVLGLGLVVAALLRDSMPHGKALAAVLAGGIAAKALSAFAIARVDGAAWWLTPGVAAGLVCGVLVLYPLVRMPRGARWIAAALAFTAAIVAVNIAPVNPYQVVPRQLLAPGPTHFLSFSSIVQALSDLWPFLAVVYTLAALAERPTDGAYRHYGHGSSRSGGHGSRVEAPRL